MSNAQLLINQIITRAPGKRQIKPVDQVQLFEDLADDTDSEYNADETISSDDYKSENDESQNSDKLKEKDVYDFDASDNSNEIQEEEAETENNDNSESSADNQSEDNDDDNNDSPAYNILTLDEVKSDDSDDDGDWLENHVKKKEKKNKSKRVKEESVDDCHELETVAPSAGRITRGIKLDFKSLNEGEIQAAKTLAKKIEQFICMVCLTKHTSEDDELVECDSCGITVHEACYGIDEGHSATSTVSSASTEPWFCELCVAEVKDPFCELCPVKGGVLKRSDNGRFVHLVCALYTPNVAFNNVDTLTDITLTEVNARDWGAKECSLCPDKRFAYTGICLSCDAGLCKNHFHATCAQAEGLLSEPHLDEESIDPYFAHCKMHTDKTVAKMRKGNYLAAANRQKFKHQNSEAESPKKSRIQRKLVKQIQFYNSDLEKRQTDYVPTQKTPLFLEHNPRASSLMLKKAELFGLQDNTVFSSNKLYQERAAQTGHPIFCSEFAFYFLERENKITNCGTKMGELEKQQFELGKKQAHVSCMYADLDGLLKEKTEVFNSYRNQIVKLWECIGQLTFKDNKKMDLEMPEVIRNIIFRKTGAESEKSTVETCDEKIKVKKLTECCVCQGKHDQHLQIQCDRCTKFYHIGCLDPPLARVPKKTRLYGWECSSCTLALTSDSDTPQVFEPGTRRLRIKKVKQDGIEDVKRQTQVKKKPRKGRRKLENKQVVENAIEVNEENEVIVTEMIVDDSLDGFNFTDDFTVIDEVINTANMATFKSKSISSANEDAEESNMEAKSITIDKAKSIDNANNNLNRLELTQQSDLKSSLVVQKQKGDARVSLKRMNIEDQEGSSKFKVRKIEPTLSTSLVTYEIISSESEASNIASEPTAPSDKAEPEKLQDVPVVQKSAEKMQQRKLFRNSDGQVVLSASTSTPKLNLEKKFITDKIITNSERHSTESALNKSKSPTVSSVYVVPRKNPNPCEKNLPVENITKHATSDFGASNKKRELVLNNTLKEDIFKSHEDKLTLHKEKRSLQESDTDFKEQLLDTKPKKPFLLSGTALPNNIQKSGKLVKFVSGQPPVAKQPRLLESSQLPTVDCKARSSINSPVYGSKSDEVDKKVKAAEHLHVIRKPFKSPNKDKDSLLNSKFVARQIEVQHHKDDTRIKVLQQCPKQSLAPSSAHHVLNPNKHGNNNKSSKAMIMNFLSRKEQKNELFKPDPVTIRGSNIQLFSKKCSQDSTVSDRPTVTRIYPVGSTAKTYQQNINAHRKTTKPTDLGGVVEDDILSFMMTASQKKQTVPQVTKPLETLKKIVTITPKVIPAKPVVVNSNVKAKKQVSSSSDSNQSFGDVVKDIFGDSD